MFNHSSIISQDYILYVIENYRLIHGEQETKNKLIEPFFKELGYDIELVEDVRTEMVCDFGIKKEKIDYILCIANQPKILVEAKDVKEKLDTNKINQLYRYFAASECKLAILTNGIDYWFFSDFDKENIMDTHPFYKLNILTLNKDNDDILRVICKVQQCSYDVNHYIVEQKTKRYVQDIDKLAELISVSYFRDLNKIDAVKNGIKKAFSNQIFSKK